MGGEERVSTIKQYLSAQRRSEQQHHQQLHKFQCQKQSSPTKGSRSPLAPVPKDTYLIFAFSAQPTTAVVVWMNVDVGALPFPSRIYIRPVKNIYTIAAGTGGG